MGLCKPITLLVESIIIYLFSQTCVKWNSLWSYVFQINFGVRRGSVFPFCLRFMLTMWLAIVKKNVIYIQGGPKK